MLFPEPKPPARRHPRRTRVGGFDISPSTAAVWASRLCGQELHPLRNEYRVVLNIRNRVRPYGVDFADLSENEEQRFIIITQSVRFNGYKDMDPKLIPQFGEGEREAIARKLLEEEGLLS